MNVNLCCQVNPKYICRVCKRPMCVMHATKNADKLDEVRCNECTLNWAHKCIQGAMETNGNYSHNMCSVVLGEVDKVIGTAAANELIDFYNLAEIYGIQKVPVK